jgi:predicted transcriptional regulator
MRSTAHTREKINRVQSAPALQQNDVELAIKAIRGLADIAAGRCAPLEEVRSRVLSRYTPSMATA